jgi:hypothetical protein
MWSSPVPEVIVGVDALPKVSMTSGNHVRESVLSDHLVMVEGLMEQGPRAGLDQRLRTQLPSDAFALLSAWCDDMDVSIGFGDWLDGGHSSASVALVRLRGVRPNRNAVLKYCPAREGEPQPDFKAFRKAAGSGPKGFAEAHLVRLDRLMSGGPVRNGEKGLFLIMGYPAGTSYRHVSMATLLGRTSLAAACKEILPQILRTWNDVDHTSEQERGEISAQGFLKEVLGARCDDGRPIRLAVEGIEKELPDFYLDNSGTRLPRPLVAALSGQGVENVCLAGLRGNGHGDLHVDNILIPTTENDAAPTAKDFRKFVLIDLSTFDDDRLLAVDPTHLLLSIVARSLKNITEQDRDNLADLVLAPDKAEIGTIPTGLAQAIQEIQRAGKRFANESDQYVEWHMECLAATAACALLFVGRDGIDDAGRRWFLRLAARAVGLLQKEAPGPAVEGVASFTSPAPSGAQQAVATVTPIKAVDGQGVFAAPVGVHATPDAGDDQMGACARLVEELVTEISDFAASDMSSTSDTATAITYALVTSEDLANVLDGARRWYEVQRPDLHLARTIAIGIAEVQLARLRQILEEAAHRSLDRTARDGLLRVAEALADSIDDVRRVGGLPSSPHA